MNSLFLFLSAYQNNIAVGVDVDGLCHRSSGGRERIWTEVRMWCQRKRERRTGKVKKYAANSENALGNLARTGARSRCKRLVTQQTHMFQACRFQFPPQPSMRALRARCFSSTHTLVAKSLMLCFQVLGFPSGPPAQLARCRSQKHTPLLVRACLRSQCLRHVGRRYPVAYLHGRNDSKVP